MKIVIPGGSGFVGQYVSDRFRAEGHDIIVVSRSPRPEEPRASTRGGLKTIPWDDPAAFQQAIDGADLVLNLAGKSVDCRYNEENKAAIRSSRIKTTKAVGEAIAKSDNPPPVWMNASSATFYRDSRDVPQTESTGQEGTGFSVGVVHDWEKAFYEHDLPATRRVALRITIALGRGGGAIPPLTMLTRLGLGGKQGDGGQMFSWIHMEDLYRAIDFIWKRDDISGPVNMASPGPLTNAEFMKTFRKVMGMPVGLPAYEWMLEIGAFVLRTETELLLKSRYVLPEKLQNAGFQFMYPDAETALREITGKTS